ncbi:MAG: UDP-N-acetylglucosamine 1-carboxyvinyltransferase [Rhodothermales bacterium]
MDKLVIRGGQPLRGELAISGSKNTALPLMAAALLADGASTLTNIPNLRDVRTFSQVIEYTGTSVLYDAPTNTLLMNAGTLERPTAPYELVKKMRASFYMLGALLGRMGEARVSLPGGCAWGPRPVDLHIEGLKAFGATIDLDAGDVVASAPGGRLRGGIFEMQPSSVGATINLLLGAATAKGGSKIVNAAREPDVVVFGKALQAMGAKIEGLGTGLIEVEGVDSLNPITFRNCADRIELGTFMIATALAGVPGEPVRLTGAEPEYLGEAFDEAFARTGTTVEMDGDTMLVTAPEVIQPASVETAIYPGFPTDLQAQWTVLMTQAAGNSRIVESIYTDRFKHIPELQRMGMNAIVVDNGVSIQGGMTLKGAKVMSTDLRASVSLVLAAMIAEGTTDVLRVYHLDRGYEELEVKLRGAGIDIERVKYNEWDVPETE